MLAAEYGRKDVLRALLECGAAPDVQDEVGVVCVLRVYGEKKTMKGRN